MKNILVPERLTQEQLARAMSVSRLTINEIINEQRTITTEMALRLEAVTEVSAGMWLDMQTAVDLHRARAEQAEVLLRLQPIAPKREYSGLGNEVEIETAE